MSEVDSRVVTSPRGLLRCALLLFLSAGGIYSDRVSAAQPEVKAGKSFPYVACTAYNQKTLPEDLLNLITENKPERNAYQRRNIDWIVARACRVEVDGVSIVDVAFDPNPSVDIDSQGLIIFQSSAGPLIKESSARYEPESNEAFPPSLLVIYPNKSPIVVYRSVSAVTQQSSVTTFSIEGKKLGTISSSELAEVRLQDLDNNGSVEVSGYGISTTETLPRKIDSAGRGNTNRVAIHPYIGTAMAGKFRIFRIDQDGRFNYLTGPDSQSLYVAEAKKLLPRMNALASSGKDRPIVNALAGYLGVIESIRDKNEVLRLYHELSPRIRQVINPTLIAGYWKDEGYPFLTEVFR